MEELRGVAEWPTRDAGASMLIALVLIRNLALTIAIEAAVAWAFFGLRTAYNLRTVALAQVVTNPFVELCVIGLHWNAFLPFASLPWIALLCLEVAAFVVEALLYRTAQVGARPWLLSAVLNATSFGMGLIWAFLFG